MIQHLPRWLFEKYIIIYNKYRENKQSLTFEQIKTLIPIDARTLAVALSMIRKRGWIRSDFDTTDRRKRVYTPLEFDEIATEYLNRFNPNLKPEKTKEIENKFNEVFSDSKINPSEEVKKLVSIPEETVKKLIDESHLVDDSEIIEDIEKTTECEGEEGL